METSNIHVETISEPEPEPLSTEDKLWRNHTEYQILNHIIAHIDNCDLLMLDYINNELNSYKSSEISTIKRMIYIKMESIMRNQKIVQIYFGIERIHYVIKSRILLIL